MRSEGKNKRKKPKRYRQIHEKNILGKWHWGIPASHHNSSQACLERLYSVVLIATRYWFELFTSNSIISVDCRYSGQNK